MTLIMMSTACRMMKIMNARSIVGAHLSSLLIIEKWAVEGCGFIERYIEMNFIKYFILKLIWIIEHEKRRTIEEHKALDEYFKASVCPECKGVRKEHSVCKKCRL